MTIDVKTLRCGECGSTALQAQGRNQYRCTHCGSVSLVEDDVSQRLDQMLDRVKDAARERLVQEERAHRARASAWLKPLLIAGLLMGLVMVLVIYLVTPSRPPRVLASGPKPSPAMPAMPREVPPSALEIGEPREVLIRRGSSSTGKLLVIVRNRHDAPLHRPGIEAQFFDDTRALGSRQTSVPTDVLAPGEAVPLLIDLPGDGRSTRQTLTAQRLSVPVHALPGPALKLARARLVQLRDDELRFAGRVVNAPDGAPITSLEALVTLYDDTGAVIGLGHGYAGGPTIAPGRSGTLDFSVQRFGRGPVVAWEYRLGQTREQPGGARSPIVSTDRVVRIAGGPETLPALPIGTDDLLAGDDERFDPELLQLLPIVALRDSTQRPIYVGELVNRSTDTIALAPAVMLTPTAGGQLGRPMAVTGPAQLYPGERLPFVLQPYGVDTPTGWRTEWKPVRKAALPGPRPALQVSIGGTEVKSGRALVNFQHEYRFRVIEVSGTLHNPGPGIVRKAQLWVTLRDARGALTGFERLASLPALAAGESSPFTARITQWGRDFASVSTLVHAE